MLLMNKKNTSISLFKISLKKFQILTPQEYFMNMKESLRRLNVESCRLNPLPEASKKIYIKFLIKK